MKAKQIISLSEQLVNSSVNTLYELTVLAAIGANEGATISEILGGTSASSEEQRKKHQRFSRVAKRLSSATKKPSLPTCPAMVRYGKSKSSGLSGPDSRTLFLTARGRKELSGFDLKKTYKGFEALSAQLDDSCINTLSELATLIEVKANPGKSISEITGVKASDSSGKKTYQRFKTATIRLSGVATKSPGETLPKLVKIRNSKSWSAEGRIGNALEISARGLKELKRFGL